MPIEFCKICRKGLGSLDEAQLNFNLAAHVAAHLRGTEGAERDRISRYFDEIEHRLPPELRVSETIHPGQQSR